MLAPLQLLDYAIDRVQYEQIRPGTEEMPDPAEIAGLGFRMEMEQMKDSDVVRLQLQVEVNQEELPEEVEGHVFHRGSIRISGWFTWIDEDVPERFKDPQKLMLVNGLSILYGVARNHMVHLTEPGPAPRLMLPSISFFPLVEEWLADNGAEDEEAE